MVTLLILENIFLLIIPSGLMDTGVAEVNHVSMITQFQGGFWNNLVKSTMFSSVTCAARCVKWGNCEWVEILFVKYESHFKYRNRLGKGLGFQYQYLVYILIWEYFWVKLIRACQYGCFYMCCFKDHCKCHQVKQQTRKGTSLCWFSVVQTVVRCLLFISLSHLFFIRIFREIVCPHQCLP